MKPSDIRTRLQDSTPFFPNMLNNGAVEICLKEDVDKYISEVSDKLKRVREDLNEAKKQIAIVERESAFSMVELKNSVFGAFNKLEDALVDTMTAIGV